MMIRLFLRWINILQPLDRKMLSWRAITALMSVVYFLHAIGCASPRASEIDVPGDGYVKGRVLGLTLVAIDGEINVLSGYALSPGEHAVSVAVEWSNGAKDRTELKFDLQQGKAYQALAFELAPVEARERPPAPRLIPSSWQGLFEMTCMSRRPGGPAGASCLNLVLPLAAVYSGTEQVAQQRAASVVDPRPFSGCCFVWIQETDTGVLVAGARPYGTTQETRPAVMSSGDPMVSRAPDSRVHP